jgi:Aerotolerance regulator N-terminal/von Willebrand factor type A domain
MSCLPLLAFGFGSPLMLWGLALGGAPILIHLLHRRRYIEMPWAAMRFLIAATKKQSRRMRLEQILLLIVRTLIVLCIAAALARPSVETFGEYFRAEGPRHRIIVVDATFSMGYVPNDRSRFDRAIELARQIVSSSSQGDAINLVRIGESAPRTIVRQPAYQAAAVLEEINQLPLLDERVDASAVLKEVEELTSLAPELARKEIYFLTDLQTATWAPRDSAEAGRVKAALKRLSDRAKLVFLDVGQPSSANTAVTSLRMSEGFVLSGRSVPTTATIRNFGSSGALGQLVELYLDDRLADTERVDLPAETDVRVDFAPAFSSGEHRLEIRLKPDSLPVDDARRLVVPVRDELQVLLVNGKPSGEVMGNATDFLKLALAPELPNRTILSPIRPTVIREGELLGTDLARFDCVFVCNVAMLTDREAEVLRGYLEAGGGVVFCLGDQVRPDNYNQTLFKDKQPLLPAKLVELVGDPKTKETAFEFDAGDFSHPIVRPFQGNPGAGLELTKTFAYFKTQVPEDRGARVALRFSSGDPAIVDAPYGRGRVILVTTSVDRAWSTWAVWGHSLIPLMHETVNYAVSGRWTDRDVLVGQSLVSHLPVRASDVAAALQIPGGDAQAPATTSDGRSVISEPTTRAGFYKLVLGPPVGRTEWFAVNVDPQESDPASLKPDYLRTDVLPGVEFTYLTEWAETTVPTEKTVRVVSTSSGLSRALLLAALCLLVVEQLLAWRFVVGLVVLFLMATAGLVWWTWTASPLSAIVIFGIMLFLAIAVWTRRRTAMN